MPGARHASSNSLWVRHDFPKIIPQGNAQPNPSAPQPGFFQQHQNTFSALTPSQGNMEPAAGQLAKKRKLAPGGEEKKPKVRKTKSKADRKESVSSHSLFLEPPRSTPPSANHGK